MMKQVSRASPPRARLRRMIACRRHALTYAALLVGEVMLWIVWGETASLSLPGPVTPWLAGVLAWTFLEYVLHRFAFHLPPKHPLSVFGARQHLEHHAAPERMPITKPLVLTLPTLALGYAAASWFVGAGHAAPFWAGMVAGYLGYELMHVAAHTLEPSEHPLPGFQRAHLEHHTHVARNFGITSPMWDRILGTRR